MLNVFRRRILVDKSFIKWLMFVSFCVLTIGGINYLIMGLLQTDLFAEVFGGMDAIASRVFYIFFGVAAIVLASTVIYKAFYTKKQKPSTRTTAKN